MTPESVEATLRSQQTQIDQMLRLITEVHGLTEKVTRLIERSDHATETTKKLDTELAALESRVRQNELTLAEHAPVVKGVGGLMQKFIWLAISFVLASCGTVAVLASQVKDLAGGK